jgi:glycosyltransferase involved in cell wall biosynthesis
VDRHSCRVPRDVHPWIARPNQDAIDLRRRTLLPWSDVRVALVYLDALKAGGYPRDVRWLAGALSRRCESVWVVANDGGVRDGLGGALPVRPHDALRLRPDVAHAMGVLIPAQIVLHRALRARTNVMSPFGQLMDEHLARGRNKTMYLRAARLLLPPRLTIHLFSEQERPGAARWLGHRPMRVAPVGVFPAPPDSDRRTGDYVLFFGRNDVHQKGIDLLLDAYRAAVEHGFKLPLLVAGNSHGDSDATIARLAEGLEVKRLGAVDEAEKWRLLGGARTLVFLSRWDGPPRPVREALAVGTPVIVSPGTNMGELVAQFSAGEVVTDRSEITAALLGAARPGQIDQWRAGAARMRDALSWDVVAGDYESIYADALA